MTKKYDPPPGRDRLPAMFVGDEEPLPQPLLPELARETAAMLPHDLQVTVEGSTAKRLPLVLAGLVAVLLGGVGIVNTADPYAFPLDLLSGYAVVVAACAGLGWLAYRHLIRHRRQYRLTDDGIVLQVWRGTDPRPWITEIPWTEIQDYKVSIEHEAAVLRVASVRGYIISLRDEPPRLSTREFIRRFVDEAERHPRAVRPAAVVTGPDDGVGHGISAGGCLGFAVLGVIVRNLLDLSTAQEIAAGVVVFVIAFGLAVWWTLDDYDVAVADRDSRRLMARLRNWLRRVLNIPVT